MTPAMTERDSETHRTTRAVIGPARAPELHIMSWNIRRRMPRVLARSADRWCRRAPGITALLTTERPTVLCAQEVLPDQLGALYEGLGRGYHHVGFGRSADGGGEACPIMYDADRLELEGWEQSALSDTPRLPGSTSWGNPFPRILVGARFRDRATSRRIHVMNTHLDPFSARSRLRAAVAIGDLVGPGEPPTVLAGDLNAGPSSDAVRALFAAGLVDSWDGARSRATGEWGTYGRYRRPRRHGDRIDWILTSSRLRVTQAAINPFRHGGWPSDHLPVQAVVRTESPSGPSGPSGPVVAGAGPL